MSPSEPDLPKDPAEYRPRPLLGAPFWAMVAFGVLCILAGAGVALLGPRYLAGRPEAPAVRTPPLAPDPVPIPPPPAALELPAASLEDVARLKARIEQLETRDARSQEAAAAALAAAVLLDTAQSSRPFAVELDALRRAAPGLSELEALARLAETGAPSRAALSASFADVAALAASRSRKPAEGAGLGARIAYAAGKIVTVRRVQDATGNGPDDRLAQAERLLRDGDVVAALERLDGLPVSGREALAAWRVGAERRAAIDHEMGRLRARAVRDLAPHPGDGDAI